VVEDYKDLFSIKDKLSTSINKKYYEYISKTLNKKIKDINFLYTQVCYMIKLFFLDTIENNTTPKNIIYDFNESFIGYCFKIIRTNNGKNNNEFKEDKEFENNNLDNDNKTNEFNKKINNQTLRKKLCEFYKKFESEPNNIKFSCPDNIGSIIHITNALSRDIQTNIQNNIIFNYSKYIKEYIKINLNLKFKKDDLTNNAINKVFEDVINNTFYSNKIFHEWIIEHKKLIIPSFSNHISITSIKDGTENYFKIFTNYIKNYVKNNEELDDIIEENKTFKFNEIIKIISNDIIEGTLNSDPIFHDWIKTNIPLIISKFNELKNIDLEKKLNKNPYIFIPYMHFMNLNLEKNKSKKKYQIIPLRTNLTPKFIPINIHALVDILDSKYLLNKIKNYYHNNTENGFILFETYFNFDSDFIKKSIKKGYIFTGLIQTNGYEIIYMFENKKHKEKKIKFHTAGKEQIRLNKELTKNMTLNEKVEYNKKRDIEKMNKLIESNKLNKKIFNDKKEKEKIKNNLLNEQISDDKNKITIVRDNNIISLKEKNKIILNKLKQNLDKNDPDYHIKLKQLKDDNIELYKSEEAYITHCYNRDIESLQIDYNNDIDVKIKANKDIDIKIDQEIKKTKNLIKLKKKEIKEINDKTFSSIKKSNKKINKSIKDNNFEQKKIKNLLNKIILKSEKLQYETEDKDLTKSHIEIIKKSIIVKLNDILKIENTFKTKFKTRSFKNFIDKKFNGDITQLFNCLNTSSTTEYNILLEQIILTLAVSIENKKIIIMEKKLRKEKVESKVYLKKESLKTPEYKIKHEKIEKELKVLNDDLNKYNRMKNKNEKELFNLFKDKNKEYLKIDKMSKKYLKELDKLNWVTIDPGLNSIFTMLSKDQKKRYNYTSSLHLNRTSRKRAIKRIEKYKKEEIVKLEEELSKEDNRGRTSNSYNNFIKYYNKKMRTYHQLIRLYDCEKLNKIKWHQFINEKRSDKLLVNDIKNKFGNDVVLILGDWSMEKGIIKGQKPMPNKRYTNILKNNFITLEVNEFRTSKIHNKYHIECENSISRYENLKKDIKYLYSMEKLKKENIERYNEYIKDKKVHKILLCKANEKLNEYINRDKNATKNMVEIVKSYITTNYRPKIFIKGTRICNGNMKADNP